MNVIKEKTKETLDTYTIFTYLITFLLVGMSFFELILSIEGNLKENIYQIGVLRSMGLSKADIHKIVLLETTGNIGAALVMGVLLGYCVTLSSITTMTTVVEMPAAVEIDWVSVGVMSLTCILIVICGTTIGVKVVNRKSISNIIKGI